MKKFKQLSAFFLALAMVLGLFPVLGHTHAHAAEFTAPAEMQAGDNVIIAQEGEHWNAWASRVGDMAAFWNNNRIYLMYPEQETNALTVNGVALKAGQDTSSRDFVMLDFDTFGIKVDDYSSEYYVEMTGAYEWSGWILLRKDVVVREGGATINSGNATQYCNEDKYVIPSGAGHVIDLTLNITNMPAYRGFDKAPMVYFATKSDWTTTGIAVSFTDELHTSSANSTYRMLLVKSDVDGHLYAAIARNSGDTYGSKAYDLGVVIDGTTAQKVNLRWETVPQADGTYTSNLYANGKFICARENTRVTANNAGTGMNKCVFIRPWAKRNVDGDTTAFNFTGTINRYYADAYTPTEATLDNLTADMLLGENTDANAITSNLTLPAYVKDGNLNGIKLVWTATGAVDAEGVVDTENGGAATLTATIEGTEFSKTFEFTVVKAVCEHVPGDATCQEPVTCTLCGEPLGGNGDHNMVAQDGKAPTCTEAGWTEYTKCSVCGLEEGKTNLPATNEHDYELVDHKDATCTEAGYDKYECSVCGAPSETPIEATNNHVYSEFVERVEPTCVAEGHETYKCATCDDTKTTTIEVDEDAHNMLPQAGKDATCINPGWTPYTKCSVCGLEEGKTNLPATNEHNHTELVGHLDPTCAVAGYDRYKCATCEDVLETPIAATNNHVYNVFVERVDATCAAEGHEIYKCATCELTNTTTIPVDKDAHNLNPVEGKNPTCVESGWEAYEQCSRCDYNTKVVLNATGHSYDEMIPAAEVTPADCVNAAVYSVKCDNCDVIHETLTVEVGEALDHDFADTLTPGETTHYYECSRCDEINGEAEHIWENEFDSICDACGKTREAAEAVALIGNTPYASLDEAIVAAKDGDKIVLLESISGPGLKIQKNITIDFGGNTYTFTDPATGSVGTTTLGMQILEGYKVTLENGTLEVAEEYKTSYAVLIQNYANLTISGMTLDGTYLDRYTIKDYNYSYVVSVNCGTVLIENTTIKANDGGEDIALTLDKYSTDTRDYPAPEVTLDNVTVEDGLVRINGATVVINSGDYTGNGCDGLIGIKSGNLTINGGTFDAALGIDPSNGKGYSMALWAQGGVTTITGGLFKNDADFVGDPTHGSDLIYAKFDAQVSITGGTFEAADERWTLNIHDGSVNTANIVVTGGSFKSFIPYAAVQMKEVNNYLATGYTANLEGDYYVVSEGTPEGYHWCEDGTLNALTSYEGKDATCTEFGWAAYVECVCGYTTYEKIPALGHKYELVEGEYICSECDDVAEYAIVDVDGVLYLYNGETPVESATVMIGGYYYRSAPGGKLRVDTWYNLAIPELNDGEEVSYYFGADGKMWWTGIFTKNGEDYLYENGEPVASETRYIDGFYYRTAPSGKLRTNVNYKVAIEGLNNGEAVSYYFDAEGKMWLTGVYEKDGAKYLYQDGKPVSNARGLEIDGVVYSTFYSGKIW